MKKTNWLLRSILVGLILLTGGSAILNTSALAVTGQEVEIDRWYIHRFSLILSPYSCHEGVAGCYANPDYHVNSWLLSQAYIPIEQSWANPALTFWTKHYSQRRVNFCYVEIQKQGSPQWDRLKAIGGTRDWYKLSLDLSAYRGESVRVKFYCEPQRGLDPKGRSPNLFNKQILYIQDVRIVSNANSE
ncbi:MAG: hypothetical protein ANABAC_2630 [Anaerolineae bacterium]|jgi:hypothetical protein|nr:MAG: hypothetical protein ANABAC_2630 [Anaerolineae bacterium]